MRKLIIGCGYLGRRVARAWRAAGDEVCALTRSTTTAGEFATDGIKPIVGDVTKPASLCQLPAVDTVLYVVGFDRTSGLSQRDVYVGGLENVLREIAPRVGRFLYVSSTSVYGQRGGEWVDENSACEPESPNGRVCLDAEQVVWKYFRQANAESDEAHARAGQPSRPAANVLRLAGIYGPGRLLSRVESLRAGTPLTGNANAFLNLIHVDDAAAAVLACEARGAPGELYLVSDDAPATRGEYYSALARLVGAPPPQFAPLDAANLEQAGLNKRCHNRKLRAELEVSLAYPSFAAGLPQALTGD